MISHRGCQFTNLKPNIEGFEGRFQQQIVFLICFRACNNHKSMTNKLIITSLFQALR